MDDSLHRAQALLAEGYTCVFCRGDQIITDRRRGVRPLLDLIEQKRDVSGYCVADKVVGKASAFLYCSMGVARIYAPVVSRPAAEVLAQNGIALTYDRLVPAIRNRTDTDICPMEKAVRSISSPEEALQAIYAALAALQKMNGHE